MLVNIGQTLGISSPEQPKRLISIYVSKLLVFQVQFNNRSPHSLNIIYARFNVGQPFVAISVISFNPAKPFAIALYSFGTINPYL